MATNDGELVARSTSKSPYQLDLTQTTKACSVLLKHIPEEKKRQQIGSSKPNLLSSAEDESDEDESDADDIPIWLVLTTKKHIADKKRLKPGKMYTYINFRQVRGSIADYPLPHSLNTSTTSNICLITADPQRTYKDLIDDPAFPPTLRSRITRVIGLQKLKTKYKPFENRRQLFAEHDIFLADDRITPHLPKALGKIFYKGGVKRPVPVSIAAPQKRDGEAKQRRQALAPKKDKETDGWDVATPVALAKEIERALGSALVHLAPSATTAVRVGRAGFTPEMTVQNIQAVVAGLVEKFVPRGWRNVRAIHIKGPNTTAFPVWLASELWVDEDDVQEQALGDGKGGVKAIENDVGIGKGKKRKAGDGVGKPEPSARHAKKKRKAEADRELAAEIAMKKERLKAQKAQVMAEASGGLLLQS